MITTPITITLPGRPAPKGSMTCIGRGGRHQLVEQNAKTVGPWRKVLHAAFELVRGRAIKGQPIGVDIVITIDRPAVHYGTGRNTLVLKAGAPTYPAGHQTGDSDKHARTVLDSLEHAGVLHDDCQVVVLTVRKAYASCPLTPGVLDRAGARVRIYPLDGGDLT